MSANHSNAYSVPMYIVFGVFHKWRHTMLDCFWPIPSFFVTLHKIMTPFPYFLKWVTPLGKLFLPESCFSINVDLIWFERLFWLQMNVALLQIWLLFIVVKILSQKANNLIIPWVSKMAFIVKNIDTYTLIFACLVSWFFTCRNLFLKLRH